GDVKRATEVFTKWIENSIQHDVLSLPPEAFQRAFERAKQEDKARALVDRAVAHLIARERHVAALQFAAATLRGDALIEAVRGITAVDLKDGTAWVIAAELYAAQSRAQEAVACLRKALRAGLPDESHALGRLVQFQAYLSDARKKLGVDFAASDRDEVRAAALKLMQTADPAPLSRQLASQLDMLDLRDLAHDLRTTSLALKPNETQPWIDYASDCGTSNRIEEALTAYERAFAAEGTNAQTLLTHAQFLENQRRPAEARKLYQKIADGTWGPNYNWVVQQAKQKLERK
ncbi:MAG: hypothetical protein JNG86_03140, partial [Verrucomicrobiaceae bacterium]|nr:hypothetical protein [Verrucomicrobiaceae bacterium]